MQFYVVPTRALPFIICIANLKMTEIDETRSEINCIV